MRVLREIIPPKLYEWALSKKIPGLKVKSVTEGYGEGYYIYAEADVPWFGRGHPIAEFMSSEIKLFQTVYFEDMERLAQAYESETGHEITIRYWQSPKDKPLKIS